MDKRLYLAFLLTAVVVFATPVLFSSRQSASRASRVGIDSLGASTTLTIDSIGALARDSAVARTGISPVGTAGTPATPGPAAVGSRTPVLDTGRDSPVVAPAAGARGLVPVTSPASGLADTVVARTPKVTYRFSTRGGAVVGALMNEYRALTPNGGHVELTREGLPLLAYRLILGRDTVPLSQVPFTVDSSGLRNGTGTLSFRAATGLPVSISYSFAPDSYLVRVSGKVDADLSAAGGGHLLITLPGGLNSEEADTVDDQRHLAYVVKPTRTDAKSVSFSSLDPGEEHAESGPLSWVVSKTKYFLIGLLMPDTPDATPFGGALVTGGPRTGKAPTVANALVVRPLSGDGRFAFELYTGPQEWRRLRALGRDLENANPYGGFMQGVVQPFATIVMRILLWMHDTLKWSYGWVLVVFGIAVRLILWPLNQTAMRSSLKMQRLQPELSEVQKKYRTNPEKQREEMMRIYKEHGMSPFSPVAGCLPMLLPMPVLFALFFVFQNTIEFRGVSFLWLNDISLKDPYYVLPVLMGASMYVLSWIGLRNSPPNPQAKMMSYIFPVMMTVFLVNLAAGLNLYYAVQNIAALPQQWLIARERGKSNLSAPKGAHAPVRG